MVGYGTGIRVQDAPSDAVEARNNIIADMYCGLGSDNSAQDSLVGSHNLFYQNAADSDGGVSSGEAAVIGDPKFVDAPSRDYRLLHGSPAIDAGEDIGLLFDGIAPDIGAYETAEKVATPAKQVSSAATATKPTSISLLSVPMTYYVSTTGNDNNDGLTTSTAWASINRGDTNGVLHPGDTVIVAAGTYTTTNLKGFELSKCAGTAASPITYMANGSVVIDHSNVHIPAAGNNNMDCCIYINTSYIVVNGFEVKNAQWGIYSNDLMQGNQIVNCKVHDMSAPNTTADNTSFYGWCGGIVNSVSNNNINRNNVIYSIGSSGSTNDASCIASPFSTNLKIYNNTMVNGRFGLHLWGGGSNQTIQNNIFTNMRSVAISSAYAGLSGVVHNYNMYYSNTANFGTGVSAGTPEYFSMDPKYTNSGSYNYHLLAGSPAINAGVDVGYSYNGSAPDLGAYETSYASATTYYVKTNGNDSLDGKSLANAWATINRGDVLGVLNPGDIVLVSAGTYAQAGAYGLQISNCSGNAATPITYRADGSVVIDQTSYTGAGVFCIYANTDYITIDGFELKNAQYGVYSGDYKQGNRITNCTIHDMRPGDVNGTGWNRWSGGIYNSASSNNLNDHNVIYNIGQSGVDYWAACVMCPVGSNVKVYNNTLVASWTGVLTWSSPTGDQITNNIITNMWKYGLYYNETPPGASNSYNLFYSNIANYGGYAAAGTGESTANPNFVNPGTYDYHLQSNSPAINAGIDVGLGWSYYGSSPDEGAYEYDSRTTYYVKPGGNDNLDGKSLANAWANIDRGDTLGVLKPGDTVIVEAGTYTTMDPMGFHFTTCSGTAASPITYTANGSVVVDRSNFHIPAPGNNVTDCGIYISANYIVVNGFEVRNTQWGIYSESTKRGNQVIGCKVHDTTPPNTTADNSWYGWCAGICGNQCADFVARNNVIYNIGNPASTNDAECVALVWPTSAKIYNNTCVNGRFGINGWYNWGKDVTVQNNIFTNMRSTAIAPYFAGVENFVHSYNLFYNNSSNYASGLFAMAGEFSADPKYTNAGSYDYHLQAGSPAINAGINLGYSYNGSAPDLGAYETSYTSATTYYVKTNGNDNLDGLSLANAWAHINRGDALGILNPGDTVIVAAGTYAQSSGSGVTLSNCSGSPLAPITYTANGSVVIDQTSYSGTGVFCFLVGTNYITLNGFELKNAQYGAYLNDYKIGNRVTNCVIHDMRPGNVGGTGWDRWCAGIYNSGSTGNINDHNVIYNIGQSGVDYRAACIMCPVCNNVKIYNNTLDASWAGVCTWSGSGAVGGNQMRNNIITDMWKYGIDVEDSADYWTNSYNLFYSNTANYGTYAAAGYAEFTANPNFVNLGAHDYHLQSSSPAINAGVDVGLGWSYTGSAPDEGAYETTSTATTYYVAITGNDSNNGTSPSTPWRTISRGDVLGVLKPGDTVIVSPGTYTQADYWGVRLVNCSGNASLPITYHANGSVVIDQTGIPKPTRMSFGIYANLGYIIIDGFEIKGSQWGVYFETSTHDNTVMNCILHDLVPGDPSAYDWYGYCGGVNFSANNNSVAHHNVTYNIGTSGVDRMAAGICFPSCTYCKAYNNTCVNSWSGVMIWGPNNSNLVVTNNALTNNWKYGIYNWDVSGCLTHTNNIFYSNATSNYGGNVSAAVGEFNSDPVYTNYSTRDLHLQSSSPAIDAGVNVGFQYIGAAPDLGAYENSTSYLHNWIVSNFEGTASTARPFSFSYGGTASSSLLPNWTFSKSTSYLDPNRIQRTITYTATDNKLKVTCTSIEYTDFPAVEWTVSFQNIGASATSTIDQICGCNTITSGCSTTGTYTVYSAEGSNNAATDFQPVSNTLAASSTQSYAPTGGYSSSGVLPYFNLTKPNNTQVMVGIGWTGTWNASFTRDSGYNVTIKTGFDQSYTSIRLDAGETIRTPMTLMVYANGTNITAGQNILRKMILAHYSPTTGYAPYDLPIAASPGAVYDMVTASETNMEPLIDNIHNNNVPLNTWWVDAGWYTCQSGNWSYGTGNIDPDWNRYSNPNGMRNLSDKAHSSGMRFLLWFEQERAHQNTWMWNNHYSWLVVTPSYPSDGQVQFGNPDCLAWEKNYLASCIDNWGIDVLRVDCNVFPPSVCWQYNEGTYRKGMREISHIQGLYSLYDYLLAGHPNLLIDNCAAGGRRLDLEMMKRSASLWRTDYGMGDDNVTQAMEMALASWIPITGLGSNSTDAYRCRSGMGTNAIYPLPWNTSDASMWPAITQRINELRSVKDCFYGDFYPFTAYSRDNTVWCAWQFDRPDLGKGIVQVFRRAGATATSATYSLGGLQANAQYAVTNVDPGVVFVKTGSKLMNGGLTVTLNTAGTSALFTYQRL